jgi:hypothetical protein
MSSLKTCGNKGFLQRPGDGGTLPGTEIGSNSAGKGRKGLNRRRLHLEGSLQLAETGDHDANR